MTGLRMWSRFARGTQPVRGRVGMGSVGHWSQVQNPFYSILSTSHLMMKFSFEIFHSQSPFEFANQKTTLLPFLSQCCQYQDCQSLLEVLFLYRWGVAPHPCQQNSSICRGVCGCLQWGGHKRRYCIISNLVSASYLVFEGHQSFC